MREDFIAEMIAPLVPQLSFVDETVGRPCIARSGFIVDRHSQFILCARLAHGAWPLRDALAPALIEALRKANARPTAIHVDNERLAATLRPACQAIAVPVQLRRLRVAPCAWEEFESYFRGQPPR